MATCDICNPSGGTGRLQSGMQRLAEPWADNGSFSVKVCQEGCLGRYWQDASLMMGGHERHEDVTNRNLTHTTTYSRTISSDPTPHPFGSC